MEPYDPNTDPLMRRIRTARRLNDRARDELLGILTGLAADGVVNEAEADFLHGWLVRTPALCTVWPGNVLLARLDELLRDGRLDTAEAKELLRLLHDCTGQLVDTFEETRHLPSRLPLDSPPPVIVFEGRNFCLTGDFALGPRRQCIQQIQARGGTIKDNANRTVDYLVIGTFATRDWQHTSYGRKIEAALALRDQGHRIAIVGEDHWAAHLT